MSGAAGAGGVRRNEFGQPVGEPVDGWTTRPFPAPTVLAGRTVRLEPLGPEHVDGLLATMCAPGTESRWTYMPDGPFADRAALAAHVERMAHADPNRVALAIVEQGSGTPVGQATYLRIDPPVGTLEVGWIMYSPQLAGSRGATEAMYLMARHAIDELGYRRYEWKCDALNEPSRRAATRLGFAYEGTFRQATMYKGRNRDSAWYAITDADWRRLRPAYERWLDDANFDASGAQRSSLSTLVAAALG